MPLRLKKPMKNKKSEQNPYKVGMVESTFLVEISYTRTIKLKKFVTSFMFYFKLRTQPGLFNRPTGYDFLFSGLFVR